MRDEVSELDLRQSFLRNPKARHTRLILQWTSFHAAKSC
jgi:hypothetical protein